MKKNLINKKIETNDIFLGEEETPSVPLPELEKKYKEQMRQIFPSKIDLPLLTLKDQIDKQIEIHPEFQRRDRWTDEKRSRFIESIIMNVPIPPIFLGEEEYGKYVVLDGRQRLTAVYRFLCDELILTGLSVWSELNGNKYSDIRKKGFASTIERRYLPAILLTRESSPQVKYEVFDRLNTGGVKAEPMEVRNAIYRGEFNSFLHELSKNPDFRNLWGIPITDNEEVLEKNSLYREMADLELVLRFFALNEGTLHGKRFKEHLSDFLVERNILYKKKKNVKKDDQKKFQRAVENCIKVFGNDAFKRADKKQRSAPYADAIMQGMSIIEPALLNSKTIRQIQKNVDDLVKNDEKFRAAISSGTNGGSAINYRITKIKSVISEIIDNIE